MRDSLSQPLGPRPVDLRRPLMGLTVLVVEDSRYASEAMRLLCLRSGARIRRADRLASAHRHLRTYRPSVVIVDLGLPDGCGDELIRTIKSTAQTMPVVLGTSGDSAMEQVAYAAGADGFLPKPVESLGLFQQAILSILPVSERPRMLLPVNDATISPDPIALRDDLSHMAQVLSVARDQPAFGYVAQFLAGLARSSHDDALELAASALRRRGGPSPSDISRLSGLVQERLSNSATF